MQMKNIRIYSERDREQVLALWQECDLIHPKNDPQKDLDRKKGFGEELFLVIEEREKIIGTVMGGYDGHRGIINYLGVHPSFRRQGLGKMLLQAVEQKLKDLGCPQVNLLVWSNNSEVLKFYKKTQYSEANDIVLLRKRLISDL
jgi:ribosomal protein S18 acetylase RimI-like enzyme